MVARATAVVGLVAVAGLALLAASGCSSGSPRSTALAPLDIGGSELGGIRVRDWKINAPRPLPRDVVLYIENGCWRCDVGPTGVERVSVAGEPGAERLLEETLFTNPADPGAPMQSWTMDTASGRLVATVCTAGYCGGNGAPTLDARSALYSSEDGGVTWHELVAFDGGVGTAGFTAGGLVLARHEQGGTAPMPIFTFFAYPSGTVMRPPAEGATLAAAAGQTMIWRLPDGVSFVGPSGEPVYRAPDLGEPIVGPVYIYGRPHPASATFLAAWYVGTADDFTGYFGYVRGGQLQAVYRSRGWNPYPGAWLDETTAVGTLLVRAADLPGIGLASDFEANVPVLIDFVRGEITPLEVYGALSNEAYAGRNFVRGVIRGEFYRARPAEACLDLRERPSPAARSNGCFARGVLLKARPGETADAGGVPWLALDGPGGTAGWAPRDSLER